MTKNQTIREQLEAYIEKKYKISMKSNSLLIMKTMLYSDNQVVNGLRYSL